LNGYYSLIEEPTFSFNSTQRTLNIRLDINCGLSL